MGRRGDPPRWGVWTPPPRRGPAGGGRNPPVSEPRAMAAASAATAAAEPPLEPPGTRAVSHGFSAGPKALYSLEEPMANSSILVLPRKTAPASRRRSTTVAE